MYRHIPVMLKEILDFLRPEPGGFYIDCTLGGGGYTFALAEIAGDKGRVISFDLDKKALANAERIITDKKISNIELIDDNFKNLHRVKEKITEAEFDGFDGVVFDLGLSSAQLEDRDRGFSFQLDAPLDMSFGGDSEKTIELVNESNRSELERIILEYGGESWARRIAASIVERRKRKAIKSTGELLEAVRLAVPSGVYAGKKLHYATKTFQALRIATNDEIGNIEAALPKAAALLRSGGRLAIVSFHSLEDRIVKNFIRTESRDCICGPKAPACVCGHKAVLRPVTKKAVKPGEDEKTRNPRSRSAVLRVAEKI